MAENTPESRRGSSSKTPCISVFSALKCSCPDFLTVGFGTVLVEFPRISLPTVCHRSSRNKRNKFAIPASIYTHS